MPVIRLIVEHHLREAAFLWTLRHAAAVSPIYSRGDLQRLDETIEAHLDGLRVSGATGWELVAEILTFEDAGEIFAASQLALSTSAFERLVPVLDAGAAVRSLRVGVVSALGWSRYEDVARPLAALLAPGNPGSLVWLGLAGHGAHRRDPGRALERALASGDDDVRSRALRLAGELGRVDLADEVVAAVAEGAPAARGWAAWSAVLLGRREALPALWQAAAADDALGDHALLLAARASGSRDELSALLARPERARTALLGHGAAGNPADLEPVFDAMGDAALARAAGTAFTLLTGAPIRDGGLEARPPAGHRDGPTDDPDDPDVALPPDVDLPWPDVDACRRVATTLPRAPRLVAGKPPDAAWLDALVAGDVSQTLRFAAASERALLAPGNPLAEVRARVRP